MITKLRAALAAAIAVGGCAAPAPPAPAGPEEARIAFLHLSPLRTFQAVGRDTIYIRGPGRRWYRATTLGPCINLPWALSIGVDTRGSPTLDRFSTLIVEGERCPLQSVVRSAQPPAMDRRKG
ncbi:MAG: DUF6491 family protein [Pseudomonadota bacterium]|nr:DUF6491 family protein [Pseudomonadota bacterium]